MRQKEFSVLISDSIGNVSAISSLPAGKIGAVLVLGHGAGAGMRHPFMEGLSLALAGLGIATVRYNFPFMENKKGRPDPPAIAEKTVARMIEKAREIFPNEVILAGGKSFGGRMTSQRLSKECPDYLSGIVFFGFPLHAPGKTGIERAAHLDNMTIPMLFLQGTRDPLADIKLIRAVCHKLETARLIEFEGADHSFKAGKQNLIPSLAQSTADWISELGG